MTTYTAKTVESKEESKKVEVKQRRITSFVMVKNYRGGMSVDLEPYDFSAPMRRISFNFDQEKQHVPLKWALGIFVSQNSMKMFEKNYFTFEDLETLIEMAEEAGLFVPDSIKEPKVTSRQLQKIITKNDLPEFKKVMVNADKTKIGDMVAIARKVLPKLNYETIRYIEETYKISLKTINLDG